MRVSNIVRSIPLAVSILEKRFVRRFLQPPPDNIPLLTSQQQVDKFKAEHEATFIAYTRRDDGGMGNFVEHDVWDEVCLMIQTKNLPVALAEVDTNNKTSDLYETNEENRIGGMVFRKAFPNYVFQDKYKTFCSMSLYSDSELLLSNLQPYLEKTERARSAATGQLVYASKSDFEHDIFVFSRSMRLIGAIHVQLAPKDSDLKGFLGRLAANNEGVSIWVEQLSDQFAVDSQVISYIHYADVEYAVNMGGVKTRHALVARKAQEQLTEIYNSIVSGLQDFAAEIKPAVEAGKPVRACPETFNCLTRYNTLNVAPRGGIYFQMPQGSDWEADHLPTLRTLASRNQGVAIMYGESIGGARMLAATPSSDLASSKTKRPWTDVTDEVMLAEMYDKLLEG